MHSEHGRAPAPLPRVFCFLRARVWGWHFVRDNCLSLCHSLKLSTQAASLWISGSLPCGWTHLACGLADGLAVSLGVGWDTTM